MSPASDAPRGDATREALISAATAVFARHGFHAVSTREIAEAAQTNQALIGYHFGSKEGLYLAVFDHISLQIQARIGPFVDAIDQRLAASEPNAIAAGRVRRRDDFLELLLQLFDGLASMFASEASAPWAQLIMREQQAPTEAFERLYSGFMGRVMALVSELVRRVRPETSPADARLITATLFGQVMVFRVARAGALRHLGWKQIGRAELAAIQRQLRINLTAILNFRDQ